MEVRQDVRKTFCVETVLGPLYRHEELQKYSIDILCKLTGCIVKHRMMLFIMLQNFAYINPKKRIFLVTELNALLMQTWTE